MKLKKRIFQKENNLEDNTLDLFLMLPTTFLYIISSFFEIGGTNSAICFYGLLTSCFILLYKYYKEKYKNINKLFVLAFFSFVIFPMVHNYLYSYDKDSYVFNQEYLAHRKIKIREELKAYNDVKAIVANLKNIPYKILHSKVDDRDSDKYVFFEKGYAKIESIKTKRPIGRTIMVAKALFFYDSNNRYLGQIEILDETMYDAILRKLDTRNDLLNELKNPAVNIHFPDIWLDSITVFAFSNIKPISRFSQFLQMLQVISLYITVHIITSFLDEFGGIKIKQKTTQIE